MTNEMHFENGIHHEFTAEEMKLLRLLIKNHAGETAKKYDIDINAVVVLKTLFFENLD